LYNINILPLVEGVTVDYHKKKKYHPRRSRGWYFFLSVVIYRNTLNQRQYVLYHTECPSEGGIAEGGIVEGGIAEGGIAGCGISLQYHPLLWWSELRKVREKYHIHIYQWNCRIIKEICIKYNIVHYTIQKTKDGATQAPLKTTLGDKVCHWLAAGRWFSPGIPFPRLIKLTAKIQLKYVTLNTTTLKSN
jgi:hypothetical protein